jgi:hypothetical protein
VKKLRVWAKRFLSQFHKQSLDRELQDELDGHLEMHVADNIRAGMDAEDARRDAMLRLGGIEPTKEAYRDQRGVRILEAWWRDLRYGARMLAKNRGYTFVVVSTLALAMAIVATTFATANAYLVRSLPFPSASRIKHGLRSEARRSFDHCCRLWPVDHHGEFGNMVACAKGSHEKPCASKRRMTIDVTRSGI